MALCLCPTLYTLLLLMGFSELQDRCGAVMSGNAAGEIFGHLDPHNSDEAIHTASLFSLDPELSGFSEGWLHRIASPQILALYCCFNHERTLFSSAHFGHPSFILNKLIAVIWEDTDIITKKSDGVRDMSSQTIRQVGNKPPALSKLSERENKGE